MHKLLFILLILLNPYAALASIDEEVAEISGRVSNIESLNKNDQGVWLPVPIPVSNPTIGTGLQAALFYLHPKASTNPTVLNPTSGIVGMYTDSDSWFAGGFHDGNLNDDLYRFRVLAGSGQFNLDYFGVGDDSTLKNDPIPYSISTDAVFSQLLRRLPDSKDWYIGLRYSFIRSNVFFDEEANPDLPTVTNNMVTSSLGLITNFDSRDDNYHPTKGVILNSFVRQMMNYDAIMNLILFKIQTLSRQTLHLVVKNCR